jgi:STE24 endopeptidase
MKDRSQKYETTKIKLSLIQFILELFFLFIFYISNFSLYLEIVVKNISSNTFLYRLYYVSIFMILNKLIFLPLNFYTSYTLEHTYNLSKESKLQYFKKIFKSFFLSLIMFIILIEVFYFSIDWLNQNWWLFVWIFWILFNVLVAYIFPILIVPMFYNIETVENQDLESEIELLCKKTGFVVKKIKKINLSKETVKANAALTGFGNSKTILLGDTLLKNFTTSEITTVVAHELGHLKKKHILKLLLLSAFFSLFILKFSNLLLNFLFLKLNISMGSIHVLPLLLIYLTVISFILLPLQNLYSRKLEYEADSFAIQITKDKESFVSALNKLADLNLANKTPHPLIEAIFYSHPSIFKRIKAIKERP